MVLEQHPQRCWPGSLVSVRVEVALVRGNIQVSGRGSSLCLCKILDTEMSYLLHAERLVVVP